MPNFSPLRSAIPIPWLAGHLHLGKDVPEDLRPRGSPGVLLQQARTIRSAQRVRLDGLLQGHVLPQLPALELLACDRRQQRDGPDPVVPLVVLQKPGTECGVGSTAGLLEVAHAFHCAEMRLDLLSNYSI